jgi:thymidylate kinase
MTTSQFDEKNKNLGLGVCIAVESSDTAVSQKQFTLLADTLRSQGYSILAIDFTTHNRPATYFLQQFKQGTYGDPQEVGPYAGSLLYALDRFQSSKQIRRVLQQGIIVLVHGYTGRSATEFGTYFTRSEERKGFYLWHDGQEERVFNIPRPNINFILRSSPMNSSKRDDLAQAYEDLCEVFPKDYIVVDRYDDNELLTDERIQALLMSHLTPILPAKADQDPAFISEDDEDSQSPVISSFVEEPGIQAATKQLMSLLLINEISSHIESKEWFDELLNGTFEIHNKNSGGLNRPYYIPPNLNPDLKAGYVSHMDKIIAAYHEIARNLTVYLANAHGSKPHTSTDDTKGKHEVIPHADTLKAYSMAAAVLPLATTMTVSVQQPVDTLKKELSGAGRRIGSEARSITDDTSAALDQEAPNKPTIEPGEFHEIKNPLSSSYVQSRNAEVSLTGIWPRNEFDLIPFMLYKSSDLPLSEIRQVVTQWTYAQKIEVFQAYIASLNSGPSYGDEVLSEVRYEWDVVCDWITHRHLQTYNHTRGSSRQASTPRNGYEVPPLIEEAGLVDVYEEAFSTSLRLHSLLQQGGYRLESEYAVLLGHKNRYRVSFTAAEIMNLIEDVSRDQTPRLYDATLDKMLTDIEDRHPLLFAQLYDTE